MQMQWRVGCGPCVSGVDELHLRHADSDDVEALVEHALVQHPLARIVHLELDRQHELTCNRLAQRGLLLLLQVLLLRRWMMN